MKTKLLIIIYLLVNLSVIAQNPPDLPQARYGHEMITLPDGSVILIGGEDASGHLLNDMHTFDGAWSEVTPDNDPPPPRRKHAAWVEDDDVYIHGGIGDDNLLDDMWKYNIETNEWTQIEPTGDIPSARYGHTVVRVNDKDYLYGGKNNSGSGLLDFWSYNNQTNEWQEDTEFHPPSAGHAIGVIGTKIYAYGGIRWDENDIRDDVRYYNTPLGNAWTYTYTSGDVPGPFALMCHTFLDNCMYLFGGKNTAKEVLDTFYKFNMETETWQLLPTGPPALYSGSMAATWNDRETKIILFGGLNSSGNLIEAQWEYDLQTESWETSTATDEPTPPCQTSAILHPIYPNPFNPTTNISFSLENATIATLNIYNLKGQLVKTLVQNQTLPAGDHSLAWHGNTDAGNNAASGIYFVKLHTKSNTSTQKMLLLK
jgi:hypothetical protein